MGTTVKLAGECGTCFANGQTGKCADPPSSWQYQVSQLPPSGPSPGVDTPGAPQQGGNLTGFPSYAPGSAQETTYHFVSCVATGFLHYDVRSVYGTDETRNGDWLNNLRDVTGSSKCYCFNDIYGLKGDLGASAPGFTAVSNTGTNKVQSGVTPNDANCNKFGEKPPALDCPTFCQVKAELTWIHEGTSQWHLANERSIATLFAGLADSLGNATAQLHETGQDKALLDLTPQAQFDFLALIAALLSVVSFLLGPEFPWAAALVGIASTAFSYGGGFYGPSHPSALYKLMDTSRDVQIAANVLKEALMTTARQRMDSFKLQLSDIERDRRKLYYNFQLTRAANVDFAGVYDAWVTKSFEGQNPKQTSRYMRSLMPSQYALCYVNERSAWPCECSRSCHACPCYCADKVPEQGARNTGETATAWATFMPKGTYFTEPNFWHTIPVDRTHYWVCPRVDTSKSIDASNTWKLLGCDGNGTECDGGNFDALTNMYYRSLYLPTWWEPTVNSKTISLGIPKPLTLGWPQLKALDVTCGRGCLPPEGHAREYCYWEGPSNWPPDEGDLTQCKQPA